MQLIGPGLRDLASRLDEPALVGAAVEATVRWSMKLPAIPAGRRLLDSDEVVLAGGVSQLTSGRVGSLGP